MSSPLVSVVMPVYNASRYLSDAIDSILGQTFEDFELIAIDDGSSDRSLDILKSYERLDSRVHIISRPNTGIVGALNDGIQVAAGEYIARMDADDMALPKRFVAQVEYMEHHPECVVVGTNVMFTCPRAEPHFRSSLPDGHVAIERELLLGNGGAMIHPTLMMRRVEIVQIGGYRRQHQFGEEFDLLEDLDLYLRLAMIGKCANLSDVLLMYRRHPDSITISKKVLQNKLTYRVVCEALVARGRDIADAEKIIEAPELSPLEYYRKWGWNAIERSRPEIAQSHAWNALRRAPLSLRNWRLFACALRCRFRTNITKKSIDKS